jgi:hypothetical protein
MRFSTAEHAAFHWATLSRFRPWFDRLTSRLNNEFCFQHALALTALYLRAAGRYSWLHARCDSVLRAHELHLWVWLDDSGPGHFIKRFTPGNTTIIYADMRRTWRVAGYASTSRVYTYTGKIAVACFIDQRLCALVIISEEINSRIYWRRILDADFIALIMIRLHWFIAFKNEPDLLWWYCLNIGFIFTKLSLHISTFIAAVSILSPTLLVYAAASLLFTASQLPQQQ